jgi:hypothetical protein
MTKFESMHVFTVSQTGPTGIRFEESYQIGHGLLVALFALSYLMDEGGYGTHKVTAIKLLRQQIDMGLREAKEIVGTIWEKFELNYSGEVVYREEPFSVTYKGWDE